jgi:hypothetical protein
VVFLLGSLRAMHVCAVFGGLSEGINYRMTHSHIQYTGLLAGVALSCVLSSRIVFLHGDNRILRVQSCLQGLIRLFLWYRIDQKILHCQV